MSVFDFLSKKNKEVSEESLDELHEYCPRCNADLTMQKGYSNELPYWVCLGCGEMLINPETNADSCIIWKCDGCGALLNNQNGFNEECGEWICTECGFSNRIDESELYLSEDEYQAELNNPYKGLPEEDVIALAYYQEEASVAGRNDILLVRSLDNNEYYIKKYLRTYDKSVYEFLMENPISHMPRIVDLFESNNFLIVIEEYVDGKTIETILKERTFTDNEVISIIRQICEILNKLHNLPNPIVHRDIKPSNVIITENKEVYLLDINVAKWFDPEQKDDTRYLGTLHYAAPEQVGFGFSASSDKSDIYGVGILMNEMLTGKYYKEMQAEGDLWNIIKRCINMNPDERYTANELILELDTLEG